jgi:hypothetical protein
MPWARSALLLLGVGACQRLATGPSLEAKWTGSDTGRIAVPATAGWCERSGVLSVTGVREDVGFGIAIYPAGAPQSGAYQAFDPGIDSARRPGVAAAARWFSDADLTGYQSDSGGLDLRATGGVLDGSFQFRMRSLNGKDTIDVTGRLRRIRPGACPVVDSVAPPGDTP